MNKIIDFSLLREYDSRLKDKARILKRNQQYFENDVVSYEGVYLRSNTLTGTTGNTKLNLSSVTVGDTLVDGSITWQVIDPFSSSSVDNWLHNKKYNMYDLVIYDNMLYQCKISHVSTNTFDKTRWQLIGGAGATTVIYENVNWSDVDQNITVKDMTKYSYIVINYSASQDGVNTDMSDSKIILSNDVSTIPLFIKRSNSVYALLHSKILSNTSIQIKLIELIGYTKYRINYIIGIGNSDVESTSLATASQIEALF